MGVGPCGGWARSRLQYSSLTGPSYSDTPDLTERAIALGPWLRFTLVRGCDRRVDLFGALDLEYSRQSITTKVDASFTPTGASADGGAAGTDCGSTAVGSRILVEFDTADAERVTNLQWTDSAATLTPNLAAAGGTLQCSDPLEFFGQAYGAEGMLPAPVIAGDLATLVRCGFDATITSAPTDCGGTAQFPVTTEYHSYAGARANELRVTRTFGFGATAAVFPQTILRPYVPRLPVAKFSAIIYPNQAGTAVTVGSPGGCATDCLVPTGTTWSGRWYADVDPTSGQAMIVLRDPALTSAVSLAINNDGLSASNLSSFLLLAPGGGWLEPVTEIEYLCFADLTSWPQAARTAATLPAGCGP